MRARRVTDRSDFRLRTAFGAALFSLLVSVGAAAQTAPQPAPIDPAAPGAPPPTAPPPPPGAEQPLPPPAEPTAPAEPAPLAESPLVAEPEPVSPPPLPPEDEPADDSGYSAGPFSRGSIRLTLLIGTGSTVREDYLIVGGGVGYFVADGFELGVDYEAWILASPVFHRLSPEARYVFHMIPVIKPYVGVFYRHTFVADDYEDMDHVGARGGLFYVPKGGRVFVGGGAIYERLLDCEETSLVDCDEVYPEIFFGVSI
jgi:hypothetical protein